jgi:hypothetical protein
VNSTCCTSWRAIQAVRSAAANCCSASGAPAFDGYEHTVNSHINRLRTKIEDDPRDPRRIVTVWGVGYRFEEKPACSAAVPSPPA